MSLDLILKRIKWGLKGIKESGIKDFRIIGLYYIDYTKNTNEAFVASGWAYSFQSILENPILEISDDANVVYQHELSFEKSAEARSYLHFSKDPYAGFYVNLEYKSNKDLKAHIKFKTAKANYYLNLGILSANQKRIDSIKVFNPWEIKQLGRVELGFSQYNPLTTYSIQADFFNNLTVDIIIPIYNGYEFLPRLFATIDRTHVKHKVIIINDSSPDPRVNEIITCYLQRNNDAIVVNNETNLGFLKSANKGLELSTNHAVIVNTDVELPDQWLERIIKPIIEDNSIASATPFTNSGTICSFPIFLRDNTIPENMTVDEVDSFFKNMFPIYTEIPTGVGFCMAMNRNALNKIGYFDGDAFGRGYGEENDWCQRAIAFGYKNVMVENLFIYHKHGGSFDSEEKILLYKQHESILNQKHPQYFTNVAKYCENDPLFQFRNYVHTKLKTSNIEHPIIVFNHLLGGGATNFLNGKLKELSQNGQPYVIISYSSQESIYHIQVFKESMLFQFKSTSLEAILSIFVRPAELWINELATYPHLLQVLEIISNYILNNNLNTKLFLHDYFCLCPSINLLNNEERYCGLPNIPMECERCYEIQNFNKGGFGESIHKYRTYWEKLLKQCNEIRCFSINSEKLFHKIYPNIETKIIPHTVDPLPSVDTTNYTHKGINIGFLGNITKHKGAKVIQAMANHLTDDSVKLIIIGSNPEKTEYKNVIITGAYDRCDLVEIIKREEIDIFFIPSIWPETFSFTTSEVISTNIPVAVFDIGAPAERVSKYSKGLVIPLDTDSKIILNSLVSHIKQMKNNHEC